MCTMCKHREQQWGEHQLFNVLLLDAEGFNLMQVCPTQIDTEILDNVQH